MTCYHKVSCPTCGGGDIKKAGFSQSGEQRYQCCDAECPKHTFNYEPGIKEQIIDMATNSSGIRDTARVLQISKNTVIRTIKKKPSRSFTSILIISRKPATRLRFVSNRSAWKPKSMNSGLSSAKNPINAGFGMRSIMRPMRCLPLHSALDKTRFFESYKIT